MTEREHIEREIREVIDSETHACPLSLMATDTPDTGEQPPLSDTHPEAERVLIELYRRMPAWQKLRQVCDLNRTLRELARGDIRHRHPEADAREVELRLASRWLSADTMRTVYGWDPDKEGY